MPKVADINAVNITLETGDEQSLFILLAADGSINRMGTGEIENTDRNLFLGVVNEPLFDQLMGYLNDEMLDYMGGYETPDSQGVPCTLMIGLSFDNGEENGFGFKYGSESTGPPHELVEFVMAAIELTDPWFEDQKAVTSQDGDA